jgi:UDP-glucose 4-epimerase
MNVAGARVLITGGAGLVGSHLADLLVDRYVDEVVVLDDLSCGQRENLSYAQSRGRVTLVREDIRNIAAVRHAMRGIDLVFHQAAPRIAECVDQPRSALEVLINGTFNVLEAAVAAGVQKIVAASTAAVYGAADYVQIDELHPFHNLSLFGACMIANEQLLRVFWETHGLPYVALRYFDVYGPRMDVSSTHKGIIIWWLEQIASGQRPILVEDGSQSLEFVYVGDVARANLLAMESAVSDEVCNVATGRHSSLLEVAMLLLQLLNRHDLADMPQLDHRVNPVRRQQGDTRKAQDLLGFSTQIGLREGLQVLIDWWTGMRAVA